MHQPHHRSPQDRSNCFSKERLDRALTCVTMLSLVVATFFASVAGYRLLIRGETFSLRHPIGFMDPAVVILHAEPSSRHGEFLAQSGTVGMTHGQWGVPPGWKHQPDIRYSGNNKSRGILRGRVRFDRPFATKPTITVGLTNMDTDASVNNRLRVEIKNVNSHGFDYDFVTWGNTTVHGAAFNWLAVGNAGTRR